MLFSNVLIGLVICSVIDLSDLLHNSDHDLFCNACTSGHCLHHCLHPSRPLGHLHSRGHNFQLPECHSELSEKIICYLGFVQLCLDYPIVLVKLLHFTVSFCHFAYFTADVRLTCLNKDYLLTSVKLSI